MLTPTVGLESLPVELLHEIQLFALSECLPLTSRLLHQVYKLASPLYHAQYILFRLSDIEDIPEVYTRLLQYPICDQEVVDAFQRLLKRRSRPPSPGLDGEAEVKRLPGGTGARFDIPRRLFRNLAPPTKGTVRRDHDHPLPFLQSLFNDPIIPKPNVNAHSGYALTRAVHAGFNPLIRFLLEHGALPSLKDSLAIMVAIRQRDLNLVKLLVERCGLQSPAKGRSKRRRLEDRIQPDTRMLRAAVKCRARDIVEYLTQVKGVIPDMQTLQMMR